MGQGMQHALAVIGGHLQPKCTTHKAKADKAGPLGTALQLLELARCGPAGHPLQLLELEVTPTTASPALHLDQGPCCAGTLAWSRNGGCSLGTERHRQSCRSSSAPLGQMPSRRVFSSCQRGGTPELSCTLKIKKHHLPSVLMSPFRILQQHAGEQQAPATSEEQRRRGGGGKACPNRRAGSARRLLLPASCPT